MGHSFLITFICHCIPTSFLQAVSCCLSNNWFKVLHATWPIARAHTPLKGTDKYRCKILVICHKYNRFAIRTVQKLEFRDRDRLLRMHWTDRKIHKPLPLHTLFYHFRTPLNPLLNNANTRNEILSKNFCKYTLYLT